VARIDLHLLTIESGTRSPRGFSLSELRLLRYPVVLLIARQLLKPYTPQDTRYYCRHRTLHSREYEVVRSYSLVGWMLLYLCRMRAVDDNRCMCMQDIKHRTRRRVFIHRPLQHDLILAITEPSSSNAPDLKGLFAISMEPRTLRYFEERSNGQVVMMACMCACRDGLVLINGMKHCRQIIVGTSDFRISKQFYCQRDTNRSRRTKVL
jgi:hypothetical protein